MHTIGRKREKSKIYIEINKPTSLLPLPKPLITGPESFIGNGDLGPDSGPATGSRGPARRILFPGFGLKLVTELGTCTVLVAYIYLKCAEYGIWAEEEGRGGSAPGGVSVAGGILL